MSQFAQGVDEPGVGAVHDFEAGTDVEVLAFMASVDRALDDDVRLVHLALLVVHVEDAALDEVAGRVAFILVRVRPFDVAVDGGVQGVEALADGRWVQEAHERRWRARPAALAGGRSRVIEIHDLSDVGSASARRRASQPCHCSRARGAGLAIDASSARAKPVMAIAAHAATQTKPFRLTIK